MTLSIADQDPPAAFRCVQPSTSGAEKLFAEKLSDSGLGTKTGNWTGVGFDVLAEEAEIFIDYCCSLFGTAGVLPELLPDWQIRHRKRLRPKPHLESSGAQPRVA